MLKESINFILPIADTKQEKKSANKREAKRVSEITKLGFQ